MKTKTSLSTSNNRTNNELKVFARTKGVNDINKLTINDLVTDSSLEAEFIDINHI